MGSPHSRSEQAKEVRSLQVPLNGMNLVIPNSVILQVLNTDNINTIPDSPKWLIGVVEWQKHKIPVISFEAAAGRKLEESQGEHRLLVIKSLDNIDKMPFYGVLITGIPHPVRVNDENIGVVENATNVAPVILSEVLVYGEQSSIPNFEVIEEMLVNQQKLFQEIKQDET